jgi:hypothetical protein
VFYQKIIEVEIRNHKKNGAELFKLFGRKTKSKNHEKEFSRIYWDLLVGLGRLWQRHVGSRLS